MSNKKYDLELAHTFSNNHKKALSSEQRCGCFYCQTIFSSKDILDWLEDDNPCDRLGTALCPNCGIDSVIGESSGFEITTDFLRAMNYKWFQSGNGSSIHTPFGAVEIELDDKPYAVDYEMLDPQQYNVDGLAKITFKHKKSRKYHYLKIYLKDCHQKFFAESGERLEANSVDIGEGRLTIAFCDEFYTNFNENAVDGTYLSDGLEIEFPPELSTQDFTLSVAWVNKIESEDDVRTWLAVSW